jgi:uncharacterized glyoxalase superfamily protein PhnB
MPDDTTDRSPSADAEPLRGSSLAASLTVNDLDKSLAWYCDVLGFVIDQKHERGGKLIAVSLAAGDVRILLGQDDGAKGRDRTKGEGFSLRITTAQDIDSIARRIKANGGTLDTEPVDTPWGMRIFRVSDPDGFKLAISSEPSPK